MAQRDRREVILPPAGKPYVHPGAPAGAVDHAARAFEAARQQRRSQHAVPKTNAPVAGGPPPQIPHLAGEPQHAGMTMAQHAAIERTPAQQAEEEPSGFVEPAHVLGPNQAPSSPAQLGILPADELPPQVKDDPEFISGAGSMFAANQPRMAMKYGVIRSGKFVPPQQLLSRTAPQRSLRPETIKDLQELNALQSKQEKDIVSDDGEPTEMGRAAGNVGTPSPGKVLSEEDKKDIQETLQNLDEFDFDKYRNSLIKDILNNEGQKKLIEARLKPMDVGDIITQGYIIQRVDIIPTKFWVEFKTMDGETDLALKRLIMEDSRSVEVSDRYYLDKFGLMSIAAVIHRVNDKPYGDITDASGNFDDAKFLAKFNKLLKSPMPMLASLGANAFWFDIRVRRLFVAEAVGNG
jgi:hypothetical protein